VAVRVREITGACGMDVCIKAVGSGKTYQNCIDYVLYGGKIILIGNGKSEITLNQSIFAKKELNIFGLRNSLNDF
jgi:threonine dehydrogenase-like Zn-dependent dehydrogenase